MNNSLLKKNLVQFYIAVYQITAGPQCTAGVIGAMQRDAKRMKRYINQITEIHYTYCYILHLMVKHSKLFNELTGQSFSFCLFCSCPKQKDSFGGGGGLFWFCIFCFVLF